MHHRSISCHRLPPSEWLREAALPGGHTRLPAALRAGRSAQRSHGRPRATQSCGTRAHRAPGQPLLSHHCAARFRLAQPSRAESLLAGVRAERTSGPPLGKTRLSTPAVPPWEGPGCSAQSRSLRRPEAGRGEATPDLMDMEPSRRWGPALPALPRPRTHADGDQDASGTRQRRLRGRGWHTPVRGLGASSQADLVAISHSTNLVAMQLTQNVTSNKNTIIFL